MVALSEQGTWSWWPYLNKEGTKAIGYLDKGETKTTGTRLHQPDWDCYFWDYTSTVLTALGSATLMDSTLLLLWFLYTLLGGGAVSPLVLATIEQNDGLNKTVAPSEGAFDT